MDPYPKMFKIDSELDIEMDTQYAYVKLLTGQKVRLSREIVRQMYTGIVRRSGKVDAPEIMPAGEYQVIKIEVSPPKAFTKRRNRNWPLPDCFPEISWENKWPLGTADAPIWTTSDGREILITEMEDSHVENAIRYFARRIQELKAEREDIIGMQGYSEYRRLMKPVTDRISLVKKEQKRRKGLKNG